MKFTCLIPTHNNGAVIRTAIESIRNQSVQDFEIFVVADGAPAETHELLQGLKAEEPRLHVFPFEKGERHGEAWRHITLAEATGDAVCYLSDDDFWFPDHLAVMAKLLANADFAHTWHTAATDYVAYIIPDCIDNVSIRNRMAAEPFNVAGLTVVGHRLDAYRRLPQGWSPAADEIATDLSMWRKWMAADETRFAAARLITSLHLPRDARSGQSGQARLHENMFWYEAFRDSELRAALRELLTEGSPSVLLAAIAARAVDFQSQARATAENEVRAMRNTLTWRAAAPGRAVWAALRRQLRLQ